MSFRLAMVTWTLCVSLSVLIPALLIVLIPVTEQCNEAVCGSIVSKCLLTQSCRCDWDKDCACCKECFNCLSHLYSECCSCVGMCPKPNDTPIALRRQSQVGDFSDKVIGLFRVLTEQPDMAQQFTTFSFPVDFDKYGLKDIQYHLQSVEQGVVAIKPNITTLNCTVVFMSQCMSWGKCSRHCESFGASSYRWFHDGCCECIGDNCIDYGVNESRCSKCPLSEDEPIEEILDDDIDYGQGDNMGIDGEHDSND